MTVLAIGLAMSPMSLTAAEVYKWVEADGSNSYSDKPQNDAAERLRVRVGTPTPAVKPAATPRAEPAAQQTVAANNRDTSNAEQASNATEAAETAAAKAERRAENCRRAQAALSSISHTNRLYEPLPDGERRYLSDEEVVARKDRAVSDVETWCDGSS